MSRRSDKYNDSPTMPENDQTLVNQSYEFALPPKVMTSFQANSQRPSPTPYQKIRLIRKVELGENKCMK